MTKLTIISVLLILLTGCKSAYYSAWEKMGVEKRDILVSRVESAKTTQQDAQEEFNDALTRLSSLISFEGGDLQDTYAELKDKFESSQGSAERVKAKIDSIESVAEDLFDEWNEELANYSKESLRRKSEEQLKQTQRRYKRLLTSMRRAEKSMYPVLETLEDNVLFLKHNLNASAVGALQGEFDGIKQEIEVLIKEMNQSIAQSDEFIASLKQN